MKLDSISEIFRMTKYIAFEKSGGSPADSDIYLYNIATKESKNITAHSGDIANSAQIRCGFRSISTT